ncbi:MAG: phosphotriesterase-related protein [Gammaproteobacteria bacterium]|jgi:phosphotriesterase-related protein|nr:phosphotriesterase-related protein [Gammaproteobacteria bacterium]|tara:strand:+ start:534 stop:1487 length:954 start_codon:yes stop_codon:yes gene_type:complete
MTKINTVLGSIEVEELGFTLMHEHIFNANWAMRSVFGNWVDKEAGINKAVGHLKAARDLGVTSLLDATPINLGRDVHILKEVSERSEVHVIAATGLYYNHEPWMTNWEIDRLVDVLLQDIVQGIQGTNGKAGVIKCATDTDGVTPENEKLLRVAARLHLASGIPITTHTDVNEKTGLGQIEIFEDEGVDLNHVIIGHSGDSEDLGYLEDMLNKNVTIGMDRFGLDMMLETEKRVSVISELCARGWAEQMVLSHDACCVMDWFPADTFAMMSSQIAPNWNFSFVPGQVIGLLQEAGISEDQIRAMTHGNPARCLLPSK